MTTKTQSALEAFHTAELLRFWESQEPFAKQTYKGRQWLSDTLKMWRANSKSGPMYRSYKMAISEIENGTARKK
jgi:hypothetical protein